MAGRQGGCLREERTQKERDRDRNFKLKRGAWPRLCAVGCARSRMRACFMAIRWPWPPRATADRMRSRGQHLPRAPNDSRHAHCSRACNCNSRDDPHGEIGTKMTQRAPRGCRPLNSYLTLFLECESRSQIAHTLQQSPGFMDHSLGIFSVPHFPELHCSSRSTTSTSCIMPTP